MRPPLGISSLPIPGQRRRSRRLGNCYLTALQSAVTLVETKFQTQYSPHKPDLHFLMRNDPYFHVGYAPKIKSGASHNIKFQKTKFSQKITSKIFFKVIFLEIHSCIHVFWPNSGNKFSFFSKIWQNLFENFISKILNFFEISLSNFWKKSKIYYQFWTKKRVYMKYIYSAWNISMS